jgi:hypothetical protein
LYVNGMKIDQVREYKYLGVVFSAKAKKWNKHVKYVVGKAIAKSFAIRTPSKLSLDTALQLFHMCVEPVATYGLRMIWDDLSLVDLEILEKAKVCFLRRSLAVPKWSRNRMLYLIAQTEPFVVQCLDKYCLKKTDEYKIFVGNFEEKAAAIDNNFYNSMVWKRAIWREPEFKDRSLWTNIAAHGYHGLVCTNDSWHESDNDCRCKYCSDVCSQLHIVICTKVPPVRRLLKLKFTPAGC